MSHPYGEYENSELWKKVENAIDTLVGNKDLQLTTNKEYVIGYLCECLLLEVETKKNQDKRKDQK